MPAIELDTFIGKKVDILACRHVSKIQPLMESILDKEIWRCHPEDLITWNTDSKNVFEKLKNQNNKILSISQDEMILFKKDFKKRDNKPQNIIDKHFEFCLPDSGITAIWLAVKRLQEYKLYVYGFDQYINGNHNFSEKKSQVSLFKTPVLSQLIYYKSLIKSKKIHEFSADSICM